MVSKYPVIGGSGNWTDASNWTLNSDGTPNMTTAPTAADDVFFNATTASPQVINAASVCRSLNCTGYTGTLTHNAFSLTIGDGTAGASSVALLLVSGMIYTPAGDDRAIVFASTASATNQSVDFGGKQPGNLTFNTAGQWYLASGITQRAATTIFTHTAGTLHYDGASDNSGLTHQFGFLINTGSTTRTTTFGTATFNIVGTGTVVNVVATSNTRSFASSTINMSGDSPRMIAGSGSTYGTVNYNSIAGTADLDTGTFATLSFSNSATALAAFSIRGGFTVTSALTLTGNSGANRPLIRSLTIGAAQTITCTGATISTPNCDFRDVTLGYATAGDLDLTQGGTVLVGDCGGNTRTGGTGVVTFTTGATQTWQTASGGSWGTAANWTSRVPLPQDDVTFAGVAFNSGVSVTTGVTAVRLGKSISLSGYTFSGTKPTFSFASAGKTVYGSLALSGNSNMTLTHSQPITFEGRGSFTLTSGGVAFGNDIVVTMIGGTLTLQDALTHTTAGDTTLTAGTLNANGFNITARSFVSTGSLSRTLTMTNVTFTLTAVSFTTFWNVTGSGLTLNVTGSTISLTDTGVAHTFAGNGLTYGDFLIAGGGSSNTVTITGANTFNRLYTDGAGARSIILPGSTTTTIISGLSLNNGTHIITFTASSGSATVSKSGGGTVSWDYVNLTNIPAVQASTWYAGTNSTDGGGNTNWIFTAPPSGGANSSFFFMF